MLKVELMKQQLSMNSLLNYVKNKVELRIEDSIDVFYKKCLVRVNAYLETNSQRMRKY